MDNCLKVEGMHCPNCVQAVKKALQALPGAKGITVDLSSGEVRWENLSASIQEIKECIEDIGFEELIQRAITANKIEKQPLEFVQEAEHFYLKNFKLVVLSQYFKVCTGMSTNRANFRSLFSKVNMAAVIALPQYITVTRENHTPFNSF